MPLHQALPEIEVVIDAFATEFIDHVCTEVEHRDPAVFYILKPLFVVGVVGGVKVEYIFADQNEFVDALLR